MEPNQNTPTAEPTLTDLLQSWRRNIFLNLNCHALGTIESFNPENQTASISINYTKTYVENGKRIPVEYPLLLDCPVAFLFGGETSLTMPVKKGDTCMVMFNDRSIDDWFASGQKKDLPSNRAHSMSDGVALVGIKSNVNKLSNYDPERAVLRNGQRAVGVGPSGVFIGSGYPDSPETLGGCLSDLISKIQQLTNLVSSITVSGVTSGGSVSGPPANAAAISSVGNDLNTIASKLGGMLE